MFSFFSVLLNAFTAAALLGWGIFLVLQPEFSGDTVAFNLGAALFFSLMTLWLIANSTR